MACNDSLSQCKSITQVELKTLSAKHFLRGQEEQNCNGWLLKVGGSPSSAIVFTVLSELTVFKGCFVMPPAGLADKIYATHMYLQI